VAEDRARQALAVIRVLPERPAGQHALHDPARAWPETNCYVDLWVEVVHALKLDPLAMFGFTLATDFEGDQWTFFKPPLADLHELYGIDVQELTIWRPVLEHLREQIGRKRLVLVEVDAFHLPDTHATDYRKSHSKTTIAVEMLDEASRRLGYFHNATYGELEGDDFAHVFAGALPPYTEFAKLDRVVARSPEDLRSRARAILERELARRPAKNPLAAFRDRFPKDAEWLAEQDLAQFHLYAFATLRQLGACFELAAEHLRWLDASDPAAPHFEAISTGVKALLFKVARMVNAKKKPSFDETLAGMESAWAAGMEIASVRHGG